LKIIERVMRAMTQLTMGVTGEVRAEPDTASRRRTRMRVLAGAHLAAVVLLYGMAVLAGGGFAGPPFPPDSPRASPTHRTDGPTWPLPVATAPVPAAVPPAFEAPQRTSSDVQAPWSFDANGRLRLVKD